MRKKLLVAITTFVLTLAVAGIAPARVAELGTTVDQQTAACPQDCQAIGQVSGFQIQVGTRKLPYRLRSFGKVVAFTVKLGTPNADQLTFFNKLFGGPPQVELTVLKPVPKVKGQPATPNKYTLVANSPLFDVSQYFGSEPTFALPRPLTIKPGYVVGITVPTWIPAFAVNLADDMIWRSSRDPKACDDVRQNAAQTVHGSGRTYGCVYKTARLLYTVTYIPDPKPTSQAPKKKTTTTPTTTTPTTTTPKK